MSVENSPKSPRRIRAVGTVYVRARLDVAQVLERPMKNVLFLTIGPPTVPVVAVVLTRRLGAAGTLGEKRRPDRLSPC